MNRYVRGLGEDKTAEEALRGFERFPAWMWRNTVVRDFVDWLRWHNGNARRRPRQAGFYGLDLYSLHRSMQGGHRLPRHRRSRGRRRGHGPATPASTTPRATTARRTATRGVRRGAEAANARRSSSWSSCSATRSDYLRARRPACRGRAVLCPAECADGPQRRGVLPRHVPRPGHLVEYARQTHGADPGTPC